MRKPKLQLKIPRLPTGRPRLPAGRQNFILFFAIVFALLFLFFSGSKANAAGLFFEAKNQEFTQGDEFLANVFLNTEGESVNAAEGKIFFPSQLLEIKEVRDGNSIINFWIERPKIEQAGAIRFSGIIPGGYQETKGFLFSAVFRAKTNGRGAIEIRETRMLRNDGEGTPVSVKISPLQFSISQKAPAAPLTDEVTEETASPEKFKPEIAQSQEIFGGKYFLVFATQDKGSGIDHYEVREGLWGKFVISESPYLLQNQKLDKKIFVKAVDENGNKWIEPIYPPNFHPWYWYKNYWILGILIITGLIIAYLGKRILWKKRKKT